MNEVEQLLDQYEEPVTRLAYGLRSFLLQQLPGIGEYPDPSARIIGYGYGNGYKDMICTIIFSQKGVKLGLAYGAGLNDPAGLLQGSGKVHKYIPLSTVQDFDNGAVPQLLQEAIKARDERKQQKP